MSLENTHIGILASSKANFGKHENLEKNQLTIVNSESAKVIYYYAQESLLDSYGIFDVYTVV